MTKELVQEVDELVQQVTERVTQRGSLNNTEVLVDAGDPKFEELEQRLDSSLSSLNETLSKINDKLEKVSSRVLKLEVKANQPPTQVSSQVSIQAPLVS